MPRGNEGRRYCSGLMCALLAACAIDDREVGALPVGAAGDGGAVAGFGGSAEQSSMGGGGGAAGASADAAGSLSGAGPSAGGDGGIDWLGDDAGPTAGGGASGGEDAGVEPPEEPLPPLSGELTANFARVKVSSAAGRSYIVQNNNWAGIGQQRIAFSGPSLEVLTQTAISSNGSPVSFPSVYVGRNGDQGPGGSMTTSQDDNLPLQVSAIAQIPVTFSHDAVGRDANAAFECWFAPAPPVGQYAVASAYLMVWLSRPEIRNPIGSLSVSSVNIAGRQWNIFVGLRDGAPVVTYLLTGGSIADADFDLAAFIRDAQARDLGITSTSYLTDVLGGFEIWSGADLTLSNFSVTVLGL